MIRQSVLLLSQLLRRRVAGEGPLFSVLVSDSTMRRSQISL